jgi:hypothetical protein
VPLAECEKTTQHHLGHEGRGFGPVAPDEIVVFVVFEKIPHAGDRVTAESFDQKQLKRGHQSLARLQYVSHDDFVEHFIKPNEARLGRCIGVSIAAAENLRAISYLVDSVNPPESGPAVYVVDKVDPGDHDAHAALVYSRELMDALERRGQALRGILRARVHASIARAFGAILQIEDIYPAANDG